MVVGESISLKLNVIVYLAVSSCLHNKGSSCWFYKLSQMRSGQLIYSQVLDQVLELGVYLPVSIESSKSCVQQILAFVFFPRLYPYVTTFVQMCRIFVRYIYT